MVRIQVKHGGVHRDDDEKEFLYDCQSPATIEEISIDVTEISNLQSKIQGLALLQKPRLPLHGDPKVLPLISALSEAKSYASKDQVSRNRPLSNYVLRDHIQSIEREFRVNFQILGFPDSNLWQLQTGVNAWSSAVLHPQEGMHHRKSVDKIFDVDASRAKPRSSISFQALRLPTLLDD